MLIIWINQICQLKINNNPTYYHSQSVPFSNIDLCFLKAVLLYLPLDSDVRQSGEPFPCFCILILKLNITQEFDRVSILSCSLNLDKNWGKVTEIFHYVLWEKFQI